MNQDRWARIRELYHEVREKGPGALEGADPEVRREVESLLAQDASPDILDHPPIETLRTQFGRSMAVGMKPGSYELISRIGSGGMGEVWKARDTRLNLVAAPGIFTIPATSGGALHAAAPRAAPDGSWNLLQAWPATNRGAINAQPAQIWVK